MKRYRTWAIKHKEVIFISLLALFLRLISINQSLWMDEATTALAADNSLAHYFTAIAPTDFHPPLHYLITRLFTHLFAPTDFVIRLPSLIAGVLTVSVIYELAKNTISKKAAALAGLLMATAPLHIYYSQEARMYALATLFVVMAVHYFSLKQSPSWKFAVSLSAAFLTHYLTFLMIPVFLLASKNKKNTLKNISFSIVPFLFFSPILLQQISTARESLNPAWARLLGFPTLKNIALIPTKFLLGRISMSPDWLYGLIVFIAANVYAWTALLHKKLFKKHSLFVFWLIIPPVLLILISFMVPMLSYFRLLFTLPALYLLAAAGLSRISSPLKQMLLFLALLSVNFYATQMYLLDSQFQRPPWKQVVEKLNNTPFENPLVIFTYSQTPETYRWYQGKLPAISLKGAPADQALLEELSYGRTIIYFDYAKEIYDPSGQYLSWLLEHGFTEQGFWQYPGIGKVRFLSQSPSFASK